MPPDHHRFQSARHSEARWGRRACRRGSDQFHLQLHSPSPTLRAASGAPVIRTNRCTRVFCWTGAPGRSPGRRHAHPRLCPANPRKLASAGSLLTVLIMGKRTPSPLTGGLISTVSRCSTTFAPEYQCILSFGLPLSPELANGNALRGRKIEPLGKREIPCSGETRPPLQSSCNPPGPTFENRP